MKSLRGVMGAHLTEAQVDGVRFPAKTLSFNVIRLNEYLLLYILLELNAKRLYAYANQRVK